MNERKSKNVVIIALCLTLIFMGVGFAFLSQSLTINATANISGKWEVRFGTLNDTTSALATTNTLNQGKSLEATLDTDKLIGTVKFDLVKPGDQVQYTATIVNNGNISAQLKTFGAAFTNDYIERSVTVDGTEVVVNGEGAVTAPDKLVLDEGESATVVITYTFKDVENLPEFNTDTTDPADGTNDVYQVTDQLVFGFVQEEA